MKRFLAAVLMMLGASLAAPKGSAGEGGLTVYFWRGSGDTFSYLPDAKYQGFLKSIFRDQNVTVEDKPAKARVLEMVSNSDILYTNSHGGHKTTEPRQQFLKLGNGSGPEFELTATEFQTAARRQGARLPKLIVMGACTTLRDAEQGELRIPEALGITANTRGRAYIGFRTVIAGIKCDGFYRVFFAKWTAKQADGTYLTLTQAKDATVTFMEDFVRKNGNNEKLYIITSHITVGNDMIIFGDASLRYGDLLRAKGN